MASLPGLERPVERGSAGAEHLSHLRDGALAAAVAAPLPSLLRPITPRDYDLSLALTHIDVSSAPGRPVRQIAFTAIVYHQVTFLVFITDSPGQQPPPLPLDRWTRLWPASLGRR